MKILVSPDSFKGSLTAIKFCNSVEKIFLENYPEDTIDKVPMADGGEGTVEALVNNTEGKYVSCEVEDPLGRIITTVYGILGDEKTAVIEMASSSGLTLIKKEEYNPMLTSTFGTGQLILDAIERGCTNIILGIGGSATNEGGTGMLSALGVQFLDKHGVRLKGRGCDLEHIEYIDTSELNKKVADVQFNVACDVDNPLLGENGATMIYGFQKGADLDMQKKLEKGMCIYAKHLEKLTGEKIHEMPGAGAAGGLGAGLLGLLEAKLESGFELISKVIKLEEKINKGKYDLIFTGEGQMNYQTTRGKLPQGIAKLGKKYNVPVIAIVGSLGEGYKELYLDGLTSVFSIVNGPISLEDAMENAEVLLYDIIVRIMRFVKASKIL